MAVGDVRRGWLRRQGAVATAGVLLLLALSPLLPSAMAELRPIAPTVARPRGAADLAVPVRGATDVVVEARGVAELAAFEATIRYDPAVISPTAVISGPLLPAGSALLPVDVGTPGLLAIGSYSVGDQLASGDGILATVRFVLLGPGQAGLALDPEGSGVYGRHGQSVAGRLVLGAAWPVWLPLVRLDRP